MKNIHLQETSHLHHHQHHVTQECMDKNKPRRCV
jgi:hypothetical protein